MAISRAGACPGEQEVGHVGAGNDEDDGHQAHEHLDEGQQLGTLQDAPGEFRADGHAPVAIRLGIFALERGADDGEFSLRRFA